MNRLRLAWHVLRGRPLAYRVKFRVQVPVFDPYADDGLVIQECLLTYGRGTYTEHKPLILPSGLDPREDPEEGIKGNFG